MKRFYVAKGKEKGNMKNYYTEYKWEEPESCAHNYIVPVINKIVRVIGLPSNAEILDAGCGGAL